MNIAVIPLRHMRRKWARTLGLFAAFALAATVVTALKLVSDVVGESLEKKLTAFGANILVKPKVETLNLSYGGLSLGDLLFDVKDFGWTETKRAIDGIENRKNISAAAPKLIHAVKLGGRTVGLVGVDFTEEKAIKSHWEIQGEWPKDGEEILAGANALASAGLALGGDVPVGEKRFRIVGTILPTGADDDNVLFAPLAAVQAAAGKPDRIGFVEVAALCAGCPIEELVEQLKTALPGAEVTALKHIVQSRMAGVHFVQHLALTTALVILFFACGMVALTLLNSVAERKKDIGVLRSLGFSKTSVFWVIGGEAVLIGAASGFFGFLAGTVASRFILDALHVEAAPIHFDPLQLAVAVSLFGLVALLAGLFPAWKASRIEPAEALTAL